MSDSIPGACAWWRGMFVEENAEGSLVQLGSKDHRSRAPEVVHKINVLSCDGGYS